MTVLKGDGTEGATDAWTEGADGGTEGATEATDS